MFDVDRYLDRIGQARPDSATAAALAELQYAHLRAVPFENLDIHRKRPIVLDEAALFDKVVDRRRGGFCYELNGLFARLLTELGYDLTRLSCRVYGGEGELGPEHDHLALLVDAEARWLVDVGFGDAYSRPLRLDSSEVQVQGRRQYRVTEHETYWTYARRLPDGPWVDQYIFTLEPRTLATFEDMCRYHQESPKSHFTQKRMISQLTDTGRVTLRDRTLIRTVNEARWESAIEDEAAYRAALLQHFGIDFSKDDL